MTNDEKYNGWTNRETWLVNLWFGDCFTETAEQFGCSFTAEEVERVVRESVSIELGKNLSYGFVADIIGGSMDRINWQEIAEHTEVLA